MANVVPLRPGITGESFAVQPHSIEAEQAIIGSALVNNAVIDRCPWLAAEAFFEPVHGRIWDVLSSARRAGRRADPVLVKRLFEDDRELAEMDGAAYLARLAHAADTITTAVDYARHVDGLARLRSLYRIGEELRMRAADRVEGLDAASIIAEYRAELDALCVDAARPAAKHISAVIDGIEAEIESPRQMWSTGIPSLDRSLGGGVPEGYVVGIEARMKGFKTGFAHTMLLALAKQRVPGCYIALEMGSARLAQRMLGQVGRFNSAMFRYRDSQLAGRVQSARRMLDDLPLFFIDAPGIRFSRLKAEANQAMQVNGCRVFVLDYWQLVTPDGKVTNKADFLAEVAQWCADHAHEHGTTWIVTSQENRGGESYGSDGLAKACDWLAVSHKHEERFHHAALGAVETLWLDVKYARDGSGDSIGDENVPVLCIHPDGPHLAEIDQ